MKAQPALTAGTGNERKTALKVSVPRDPQSFSAARPSRFQCREALKVSVPPENIRVQRGRAQPALTAGTGNERKNGPQGFSAARPSRFQCREALKVSVPRAIIYTQHSAAIGAIHSSIQ